MAEAAGCQLDQFKRSRLLMVPRLANLVAMFGQFVETRCFFSNVKGHCHGCFFDTMTTLTGQKCEIDRCKWSDWQKSLARGAATDCRPFKDSPDQMAYLCHPLTWHIVIFSSLPKPLRHAIYAEVQQHRHLKSCQEPPMYHFVEYSGPPPH